MQGTRHSEILRRPGSTYPLICTDSAVATTPGDGASPAAAKSILVDQPATEVDLTRLLGEVDPLTTARILSVDELDEAIRATEDEAGFGEEPHTPSSARVELEPEPDRGSGAEL